MIAYFPDIYPDELIYSQLLRYYINSGYNAYVHAAEELFELMVQRYQPLADFFHCFGTVLS